MRALTGAIITCGAMIGLGLTAIGFGNRYSSLFLKDSQSGGFTKLKWMDMDPALMLVLVILLVMLLIGVGLTFLGLAYHHQRRHHEHLHLQQTRAVGNPAGH
jgi:ABC-type Na+ efflux pump permease subunit